LRRKEVMNDATTKHETASKAATDEADRSRGKVRTTLIVILAVLAVTVMIFTGYKADKVMHGTQLKEDIRSPLPTPRAVIGDGNQHSNYEVHLTKVPP
jgi:hypothetical protein